MKSASAKIFATAMLLISILILGGCYVGPAPYYYGYGYYSPYYYPRYGYYYRPYPYAYYP